MSVRTFCHQCIASTSRSVLYKPPAPPSSSSCTIFKLNLQNRRYTSHTQSINPSPSPATVSTSAVLDIEDEADADQEPTPREMSGLYDTVTDKTPPNSRFGLKRESKARVERVFDLALDPDPEEDGEGGERERLKEVAGRRWRSENKRRQKGANFVDHLTVTIRGGRGGTGSAAFTSSITGNGPPSGGNGGPGGSVYLATDPRLSSLSHLRKHLHASPGGNGAGAFRHGSKGDDLIITVPIGTVLREIRRKGEEEQIWREQEEMEMATEERRKERWSRWFVYHPSSSGEGDEKELRKAELHLREAKRWHPHTPDFNEIPPIVFDITQPLNQPVLVARGGMGGMGNPFFAAMNDRHRPSRLASRGILPHGSTFEMELKLLADVGFVGFPNAGKSTLLRGLTGRKAEVAEYEFTTLNPQVGVVTVYEDGSWGGQSDSIVEETWKEREKNHNALENGEVQENTPRTEGKFETIRFTISDNPGLLPMASENVGLGHSFLRSIERSLALAYVIDLSKPNPERDLRVLHGELEAYKAGLSAKGAVVVLNKADQVDGDVGQERVERVRRMAEELKGDGKGMEVVVLSGKFGLGLEGLVKVLAERVDTARQEVKQLQEEEDEDKPWLRTQGPRIP